MIQLLYSNKCLSPKGRKMVIVLQNFIRVLVLIVVYLILDKQQLKLKGKD